MLLYVGLIAVIALLFAAYLITRILKESPGDAKMVEIASAIREGAMAFLFREYKMLVIFVVVLAIIIALTLDPLTVIAFVLGAIASVLAGFIGMNIATKANVRTTNAAKKGFQALKIAFNSGAVMGMSVVGLGLIGLTLLYLWTKDTKLEGSERNSSRSR